MVKCSICLPFLEQHKQYLENIASPENIVKQDSGYAWWGGIGKMWSGIMPETVLEVLRMFIYFIPFQNDGFFLHRLWLEVLCNFWSVGEAGVFLYVCNSVCLGQLLYLVCGKLWEVDSFGCFAWWCWAGHRKAQSSLRWEAASLLLQSIFFPPLPPGGEYCWEKQKSQASDKPFVIHLFLISQWRKH